MTKRLALKIDHCVVCGKPKNPEAGTITGYVVLENGKESTNLLPFGSYDCANRYVSDYTHPMFQSKAAFDRFKQKHPIRASRVLQSKKPTIFIEKETVVETPKEEDSDALKELEDDFKRVYKEQWGEEPPNPQFRPQKKETAQ